MSGGFAISQFDEVVADFAAGKMVIICDDAKRENEGDLTIATEAATPEAVSFMMRHARGLICVSIQVEIAERLNLPLQVLNNNSPYNTPFTVSVDHRECGGLGVTARSRAHTMKSMLGPNVRASDFVSPGHVFPLIANPAGVMGRRGQTEGSYDLARIAGFKPSGIICEILNPDGTVAKGDQLTRFATEHGIKITSVEEIVRYRIGKEVLVREVARANLDTDYGQFETVVFEDDVDGKEHLALIYGDVSRDAALARVHSECLTGDVFGSRRCDCGEQLSTAMKQIVAAGSGVILYLRQEGRGIGLANKLRAYELQDKGHDTVEANIALGFEPDQRDFAVAASILGLLGVSSIRLLTNNPRKLDMLTRFGIEIRERIPLQVAIDEYCRAYLETKRDKLGHLL